MTDKLKISNEINTFLICSNPWNFEWQFFWQQLKIESIFIHEEKAKVLTRPIQNELWLKSYANWQSLFEFRPVVSQTTVSISQWIYAKIDLNRNSCVWFVTSNLERNIFKHCPLYWTNMKAKRSCISAIPSLPQENKNFCKLNKICTTQLFRWFALKSLNVLLFVFSLSPQVNDS